MGKNIVLISHVQHVSIDVNFIDMSLSDQTGAKLSSADSFNTGANIDSMQLTANSVLQGQRPKSLSSTPV